MDTTSTRERAKYEQMWNFAEYRDDHVTSHASAALAHLGACPGESIIDFGAGAGYASGALKDVGLQVLAIDIAANAMCPEVKQRVPLLLGSLWDIPVGLSADWGFCCDVMEHIPLDRVHDVLQFIRKSTRRSTYFCISLRPDGCGRLIDETLHLTVKATEWWVERVREHWKEARILRHEPGERVMLIAEGSRGDLQPLAGRTIDEAANLQLAVYRERMAELAQRMVAAGVRDCLVFGSAQAGRALASVASDFGLNVVAFARSGLVAHDETVDGLPVRSLAEASRGTCHTYAIGSFGSAPAMLAGLEAAYAGRPCRYRVHLPEGPAPIVAGARWLSGNAQALRTPASSNARPRVARGAAPDEGDPESLEGALPPATKSQHLDYVRMAYVTAARESADYLIHRMQAATDSVTAHAVRAHSLAQCKVDGLVLEFGVADGGSLSHISALTPQEVHGFDSFEGLPEDWTHFQKKGRFSRAGLPPTFESCNVRLHKGWFDETLPAFLAEYPQPARFIHIDCDLYSSTRVVLKLLRDRIVPGTVIVFDEYLNYPGWQRHEHKAFAEFVAETGAKYRYLAFASSGCTVSVQIV